MEENSSPQSGSSQPFSLSLIDDDGIEKNWISLKSYTELTPELIRLWQQVPDEMKHDPTLQSIRMLYEKEFGNGPHSTSKGRLQQEDTGKAESTTQFDEKGTTQECANRRREKIKKRIQITKISFLVATWIFFTICFLIFNEHEEVMLNSSIAPGETKRIPFNQKSAKEFSLYLKLSGPFLSDSAHKKLNDAEFAKASKLDVLLESRSGNVTTKSETWSLVLLSPSKLDFNHGEPRTNTLKVTPSKNVSLLMRTSLQTTNKSLRTTGATVPFQVSYTVNPLESGPGVIYATLLLCGLYVLIIFELINRTMAAIVICTTALATLSAVGQRPTLEELASWLDVETLLLLFSMMILVAIMAETGIFDYMAVCTFQITKGALWPLITLLCAITAFFSTFLDNVTTILLIAPVTIRLCEVLNLDPVPVLISMVIFSNVGGSATPVGDPPNVIIACNKAVVQAGINFFNFTIHMTVGVLIVCVETYFQLRFMFRDSNKLRTRVPRDIQELRQTISVWKRASESLPYLSTDEQFVRDKLKSKVQRLQARLSLMEKEANARACSKETFDSTLADMRTKYKIRDKTLLIKSSIAVGFVVIVFFLHAFPELNRISLGWTALMGALLLLILADPEDLEPILHRVEWSTLLFFAALFVLMEVLAELGLIKFIGSLTESLIMKVNKKSRLAVALLLILWVSGMSSAFVDNIPLTTMMVRVVTGLGLNPNLGLPMSPLIWALSFGACLGGNGTLIGASANVVCAGVAEQHGYKFTFGRFFKIGFPIMIVNLIVASAYLLLCHCAFSWH